MVFPSFKEVDVHEDIERVAKENDGKSIHHLKGKSNICSSVTESLGPYYHSSRLLKTLADGSTSRKDFKYILFGDSTG